jgi:hypothetical protein
MTKPSIPREINHFVQDRISVLIQLNGNRYGCSADTSSRDIRCHVLPLDRRFLHSGVRHTRLVRALPSIETHPIRTIVRTNASRNIRLLGHRQLIPLPSPVVRMVNLLRRQFQMGTNRHANANKTIDDRQNCSRCLLLFILLLLSKSLWQGMVQQKLFQLHLRLSFLPSHKVRRLIFFFVRLVISVASRNRSLFSKHRTGFSGTSHFRFC